MKSYQYATRTGKSGIAIVFLILALWASQTVLGALVLMWGSDYVMGAFDKPGFGFWVSAMLTVLATAFHYLTGGSDA